MLTVFSASKLFNVPCSDGDSVGNVLKRLLSRDSTVSHGRSPLPYSIPRTSLWAGVSPTTNLSHLVKSSATISEVTRGGNVLFVDFTATNDSPLSPRPCPPVPTAPLLSPIPIVTVSPTSSQCSSLVCIEDNTTCGSGVCMSATPIISNDVIDLITTDEEEEKEEKTIEVGSVFNSFLSQVSPGNTNAVNDNIQSSLSQLTRETPVAAGVLSSEECDEGVVLDSDDSDVMIMGVEGEAEIRLEQIVSVLKAEMTRSPHLKWSTSKAVHHLRSVFGEAVMKKKHVIKQYVRSVRKYGFSSSPSSSPVGSSSMAPVINCCGITLTRGDLSTLGPQQWLNDQVINAFMRLLMNSAGDQVHITNTFFYSKYKQTGYRGIKTWLRKVKVFKLSLLLIPVHLGSHWCLAAVDMKRRRIEYYDSLALDNKACLKKILFLLLRIAKKEKKNFHFKAYAWRRINVEAIPRQLNSYDCGVFICEYARWLCTRGALSTHSVPFSQQDMSGSRMKILQELQSLVHKNFTH